MKGDRASGGPDGANGGMSAGWPLTPRIGVALLAAAMAVQGAVNALSGIADRRALGDASPAWAIWTWELTSIAVWIALIPVIGRAVATLRPPRLRAPLAIAAHVGLSLVVSLIHVTGMLALRAAAYALAGARFRLPADVPAMLLYEYRKDALTYAIVAASLALIAWLAERPVAAPEAAIDLPAILIVQDGTRRHHIAYDAIDYVQAAGNYVEVARCCSTARR